MAEPELQAPGRRVFLIYLLPALTGALTLATAVARAQLGKVRLPTPEGLIPCNDDDPVVSAEKHVAASLHAEYLACFTSDLIFGAMPLALTIEVCMVGTSATLGGAHDH